LCAGSGNGDGQGAPIYAKVVARIAVAEKHKYENTYCASKLPASWVPPGCLQGASWEPPGCSWMLSGFTAQEYISSFSTRRRVFLLNEKTCLLAHVDTEWVVLKISCLGSHAGSLSLSLYIYILSIYVDLASRNNSLKRYYTYPILAGASGIFQTCTKTCSWELEVRSESAVKSYVYYNRFVRGPFNKIGISRENPAKIKNSCRLTEMRPAIEIFIISR